MYFNIFYISDIFDRYLIMLAYIWALGFINNYNDALLAKNIIIIILMM